MLSTLKDVNVSGKRVLVRVDFNVPLDESNSIKDDARIRAALPTIKYLLDKNCSIILMSHLGRPKGKVIDGLRMDPVAGKLSELLNVKVRKLDNCVGPEVAEAVKMMTGRKVILLENLRFHKEEEANDPSFAKKLASFADIYVNDAFGASHRAHASVVAITKFIPGCAGLLLQKELEALNSLLTDPKKPFVAVLGGVKVSDKVKLIQNLLKKIDKLLVGGAMAFTFLKAMGYEVGKSKIENDFVNQAKKLMESGKIVLPVDAVVGDKLDKTARAKIVPVDGIAPDMLGLDIGPKTVSLFKKELDSARTVMWNGPMGVFEFPQFATGTVEIAKHISELNAKTVIGGGDTIAALKISHVGGTFTHISTGGGAMLEFLEGKTLSAIDALERPF